MQVLDCMFVMITGVAVKGTGCNELPTPSGLRQE